MLSGLGREWVLDLSPSSRRDCPPGCPIERSSAILEDGGTAPSSRTNDSSVWRWNQPTVLAPKCKQLPLAKGYAGSRRGVNGEVVGPIPPLLYAPSPFASAADAGTA